MPHNNRKKDESSYFFIGNYIHKISCVYIFILTTYIKMYENAHVTTFMLLATHLKINASNVYKIHEWETEHHYMFKIQVHKIRKVFASSALKVRLLLLDFECVCRSIQNNRATAIKQQLLFGFIHLKQ